MSLMTIGYNWFRPDRITRTGVIEPYATGISPVAAAQATMARSHSRKLDQTERRALITDRKLPT